MDNNKKLASIADILAHHIAPNEHRFEMAKKNIEHMEKFYTDKAAVAPGGQAKMFSRFAATLKYYANIANNYFQLIEALNKVFEAPVKEQGNDKA